MERLRALRRRAMLTQKELAERVGVTYQTVQSWEAGNAEPRLRHLRRLCEVLGVTPQELLGDEWNGGKAAA